MGFGLSRQVLASAEPDLEPDLGRTVCDAGKQRRRIEAALGGRRDAQARQQLGKALLEEYGVHQQFHTHADSHVGTYKETVRFLEVTNPEYTNLCLDTGHFAYYGGDNLKLIAAHPERIGYLHLKDVLFATDDQRDVPLQVWRTRALAEASPGDEVEVVLRATA